ncbi:MAG: response regulator, partial [Oscillospiraceae bacterium]|nr:response regulator [Oscillospiraceae bacterium]
MRHYDASARILIVDDDNMNRSILHTLFEDEYDVLEACDGQEAIDILVENNMCVSAILLDIFMPRVDGFGVLEFLQSRTVDPPIPVFFITAGSADDVILRGFDMGVLDVIIKPFVPIVVKRRISTALELYERRYAMEQTIRRQLAQLQEYAERLHDNDVHMVNALSTIVEFRSFESGSHIQRVRNITDLLCREYMRLFPDCGLTDEIREVISIASVMHDVGKISIPDSILAKPGRLTDSEMEIMREHCVKGVELLEVVHRMSPLENAEYY